MYIVHRLSIIKKRECEHGYKLISDLGSECKYINRGTATVVQYLVLGTWSTWSQWDYGGAPECLEGNYL